MNSSTILDMEKMYPYIKDVTEFGGEFKLITAGTSMLPMFRDRKDTAVLIKKKESSKKYDVVLYIRNNGQFVLHRVVGKDNSGYIMCGDNQYKLEKGISENQIVALLTAYIKNGRRIECKSFQYRLYSRYICYSRSVRHFITKIKNKLKLLFDR